MVPMLNMAGKPYSPETLLEKRHNLSVVATSHNIAQVVSVLMLLVILGCEAVVTGALGLSGSSDAAVSTAMPAHYRTNGITGWWRGEITRAEVAIVLLMVCVVRAGFTSTKIS